MRLSLLSWREGCCAGDKKGFAQGGAVPASGTSWKHQLQHVVEMDSLWLTHHLELLASTQVGSNCIHLQHRQYPLRAASRA